MSFKKWIEKVIGYILVFIIGELVINRVIRENPYIYREWVKERNKIYGSAIIIIIFLLLVLVIILGVV